MARNITIIPPQIKVPSTVTSMLEIVRVVPINQRMIPMLPTYVTMLPAHAAARQYV